MQVRLNFDAAPVLAAPVPIHAGFLLKNKPKLKYDFIHNINFYDELQYCFFLLAPFPPNFQLILHLLDPDPFRSRSKILINIVKNVNREKIFLF
jgi:hypothetical protein